MLTLTIPDSLFGGEEVLFGEKPTRVAYIDSLGRVFIYLNGTVVKVDPKFLARVGDRAPSGPTSLPANDDEPLTPLAA